MPTRTIATTAAMAALAGSPALAQEQLTTTFQGGNGHQGAMFDLTAKREVTIVGFDWNHRSGVTPGPASIEVYYVADRTSFVGKENNAALWQLLGAETVPMTNPNGTPTHVGIRGLTIEPGETIGIYFTRTDGTSLEYTNGPLGVFEDDNLRFEDRGVGKIYPFGTTFNPRIWNGTIYYERGGAVCYPDCDGNNQLDFFDFLCFQNAFLAGDPYADCDGNQTLDFFDFLCFQNEFLAGCP